MGEHIGNKTQVAHASFVYFIRAQASGLIKIGRAKHPLGRLQDLQVGSPDELELVGVVPCEPGGALCLEAKLHDRLKRHRVRGEWFVPHLQVLEVMDEMAISHADHVAGKVHKVVRLEAAREMAARGAETRRAAADARRQAAIPYREGYPAPTRGGRKAILAHYKAVRGIT